MNLRNLISIPLVRPNGLHLRYHGRPLPRVEFEEPPEPWPLRAELLRRLEQPPKPYMDDKLEDGAC